VGFERPGADICTLFDYVFCLSGLIWKTVIDRDNAMDLIRWKKLIKVG